MDKKSWGEFWGRHSTDNSKDDHNIINHGNVIDINSRENRAVSCKPKQHEEIVQRENNIAIDLVSTMIIINIIIIIINAPIAIAIDITITLTIAVYAPPKKASPAPARGLIMRMSFNK